MELTRKLISALEATEKLPVYTYDLPGSGYGLQVYICEYLDKACVCKRLGLY